MPTLYKGDYNLGEVTMPVECVEHEEGKLDKIQSGGKDLPEDLATKLYPKLVIAITNYKNRMRGVAKLPTQVNLLASFRWYTREEAMQICKCAMDGDCAMLNMGQSCTMANEPEKCPFY